jgi:hypothetical protein
LPPTHAPHVQLTFRAACDLPAGTECFIAYVATEEPTYVLARWCFDGAWMAPGWRLDGAWMAPGWRLGCVWLDCVWIAS